MHIDTRELETNSLIEGDICIVGTGAAGLSIAKDWLGTPQKVILLESGGFGYDSKIQELNAGSTTGQNYFSLQSTRLRYFGGTTGHWVGMCSPFEELDFVQREYVTYSGWPINRQDLEPYYRRANETLQIEDYGYDYNYWKEKRENIDIFPLDDKVIWNKIWEIHPTRFGNVYRDTILNADNIHLYTYATATEIVPNENISLIQEIKITNHTGKTHRVRAQHFILACGAIQNARLLLASNQKAPNGIGNDYDVVGRYFMEHLEFPAGELWLFNPFKSDLYTWGKRPMAELAITQEAQFENKILNGTLSLYQLDIAKTMKTDIEAWVGEDPKEAQQNYYNATLYTKLLRWKARLQGRIWDPKAFSMSIRIEQAPNPNSRVTLDSERDSLGIPRPSLHWEIGALEKRSIRKIYEIVGQQMGSANLGRVKMNKSIEDPDDLTFPENTSGGFHHMGTTRMCEDPKYGVVDSNCKVHGISNLYVAGSGCFATSGAPNPTFTLIALSLRLSDHVKGVIAST